MIMAPKPHSTSTASTRKGDASWQTKTTIALEARKTAQRLRQGKPSSFLSHPGKRAAGA